MSTHDFGISKDLVPFATGIGALCIEWVYLEEKVCGSLVYLGGFPEEGMGSAIIRCFDFRDQLKAIKLAAVERIKDHDCVDALFATVGYIDNVLRPRRNRYVHDMWVDGDNAPDSDPLATPRLTFSTRIFRPQSHKPRVWEWYQEETVMLEEIACHAQRGASTRRLSSRLVWPL